MSGFYRLYPLSLNILFFFASDHLVLCHVPLLHPDHFVWQGLDPSRSLWRSKVPLHARLGEAEDVRVLDWRRNPDILQVLLSQFKNYIKENYCRFLVSKYKLINWKMLPKILSKTWFSYLKTFFTVSVMVLALVPYWPWDLTTNSTTTATGTPSPSAASTHSPRSFLQPSFSQS